MSSEPSEVLEDLIRELSSEISQMHRWLAEAAGLNATDLMALYSIRNAEGQISPKTLGETLGLTSGATTIMLNRLEDRGLVARTPNPTDRRAVLLSLGKGAETEGILNVRRQLKEANAEVLAQFSEDEAKTIRRFLAVTIENTRRTLHDLRTGQHSK